MDVRQAGSILIIVGFVLIVVGLVAVAGWSLPNGWRPGRLPGDFTFRRGDASISILLGTSILLSAVLTLIFGLWRR